MSASNKISLVQDKVFVPAGPAWIGSDRPGEGPPVQMHIRSFYIDRYPITNRQFADFLGDGGYRRAELWEPEGFRWARDAGLDCPAFWGQSEYAAADQPVTGVSFYEAQAYSRWTGAQLPTEAQWEKAARGADGRTYPWGEEEPQTDFANFAPEFSPVRSAAVSVHEFPHNESPYGCRQMAGNVLEWCIDTFHVDTPACRTGNEYVEVRPGPRRLLKGGSWIAGASRLRAAARFSFPPDFRDNITGFRTVHVAKEEPDS